MIPSDIINIVCRSLELDVDKLKSKTSVKEYVHGRFIICYLIRKQGGIIGSNRITKELANEYSYRAIAYLLGRILKNGDGDHAWALNGEFICIQLLKIKDKEFCAKYEKVRLSMIPFVSPMDKTHST